MDDCESKNELETRVIQQNSLVIRKENNCHGLTCINRVDE